MAAVTNTTPLNYLILIGEVEILPEIFGRVLVPQVVVHQLQHSRAPEVVRIWAAQPPAWLEITPVTVAPDAALLRLQAGEREAVMLAEQEGADLFVVDERTATRAANRRGLATIGTLGLLDRAAERGFLDFERA